jgi:hypothetical protein
MGWFSKFTHAASHVVHKATHGISRAAHVVTHAVAKKVIKPVTRKIIKPVLSKVIKPVVHVIHDSKVAKYIASHTKVDDLLAKAARSSAHFVKDTVAHPLDTLKKLSPGAIVSQLGHTGAPQMYSHNVPTAYQHQPVATLDPHQDDDSRLLLYAGGVGLLALVLVTRR